MRLEVALSREEMFSFTPDDGDAEIHIMSGQLRQWLLTRAMDKVIDLTFPEESLESIIQRHGLEQPRIESMTEAEALEPVIVGLWPSGVHVLIDGGHRRYYWAARGRNVIRGWAVPEVVWRAFEFDPKTMPGVIRHHKDGSMLPQRRNKR